MILDNSGVRLDGRLLSEYNAILTAPVEVGEAKPVTSYTDVPGISGSADLTLESPDGAAYRTRRSVSLSVASVGSSEEVAYAKRSIGALVGKVVTVESPDDFGAWRGRLSVSAWTDFIEEHEDGAYKASTATVTVNAEPYLILAEREIQLDADATINVLGNTCAWPTLTMAATSSTPSVTVLNDGADQLKLAYSLTVSDATITANCQKGYSTLKDGSQVFPTIESDYPYLMPGECRFVLSGCTATLRYNPLVMV